jgi:hypothetical protein
MILIKQGDQLMGTFEDLEQYDEAQEKSKSKEKIQDEE